MFDVHLDCDRGTGEASLLHAVEIVCGAAEGEAKARQGVEDLDGSSLEVIVRRRQGEFPWTLEIYRRGTAPPTEAELGRALAKRLGCRVLLSDDDVSPYTWLLTNAGGPLESVAVDPEALGRDEFVLSG